MQLHITMTRNRFFYWICNTLDILSSIHAVNYKYTWSTGTKILIPQPQKSTHELQIILQAFCSESLTFPEPQKGEENITYVHIATTAI